MRRVTSDEEAAQDLAPGTGGDRVRARRLTSISGLRPGDPPVGGAAAGAPRVAVRATRPTPVRRPVARGDRRGRRAPPDRRGGLAGLRRPRGRRFGAARPPDHLGVGRRRPRRVDDHVVGARCPVRGPAQRLPGGAAVGTVLGVPPDRGGGGRRADRLRGRPGRDLERHAVPLPPVGPVPPGGLPPPRPRRDVEDGPAPGTGPTGLRHRAPCRPAVLPAQPGGHAVVLVEGGDRGAPGHRRAAGDRGPAGGRTPILARAASAPTSPWWWPWAGWSR